MAVPVVVFVVAVVPVVVVPVVGSVVTLVVPAVPVFAHAEQSVQSHLLLVIAAAVPVTPVVLAVSVLVLPTVVLSTLVVVVVVVVGPAVEVSVGGLHATIIAKQAITAKTFLKIIIKSF